MTLIRIIGGDFRSGRAIFDDVGIAVRTRSGRNEVIEFGEIREIRTLEHEKRSTVVDKFAGAAAGGILGGIATGALAGGLTGPAGAVIGAIAGTVFAVRRTFYTCRMELRDGRKLVATARSSTWAALRDAVRLAPPIIKPVIVDMAPMDIPSSEPKTRYSKLIERLPWSKRGD